MTRMSVDQRRALLIQAAITAMSRDGVAGTGTRAIVAEANMTIGVFHYCFRSKDELLIEVARTLNQRSFAAAGEILRLSRDPAEVLRSAITAYWEHVQAHPNERMLLFELTLYSLRRDDRRETALEQYRTYVNGMQGFLAAVAGLGNLTWRSDPEVLARYVLAQLQGITLQWLTNHDGDTARALLDHLTAHLLAEAGLAWE